MPQKKQIALSTLFARTSQQASAGLTAVSYTLSDAQIKALPTSSFTMVLAPGSGNRVAPFLVDVTGNIATAYTNINANAFVYVAWSSSDVWSNYLANDNTLGYTLVNQVFGSSSHFSFQFLPYTLAETVSQWGNLVSPNKATEDNKSLQLKWNNGGSGNLTGGTGTNVMTMTVFYAVVAD